MVDPSALGDSIETREDLASPGDPDAGVYAYWMAQEAIAEKEDDKWIKKGRKIVERYRNERSEAMQGPHRFNILWSNVQTLIPTLYGRTPKPDVQRRFMDQDPAARLASMLLERCLSYSVDAFDFDDVMEACTEDRLLPGRGVARVLYVPKFGDKIQAPLRPKEEAQEAAGSEQDNEEFEQEDAAADVVASEGDGEAERADVKTGAGEAPLQQAPPAEDEDREVVDEEVIAEYVFWEDYKEGPARKERQVPWKRYRAFMTRDQLIERFGKKKGKQVNLDYTPPGSPTDSEKDKTPPDLYKKAAVHEIWDGVKREVVWFAPSTPDLILDKLPDPLKLPGFYPSPPTLDATTTNDKRTPVADYVEYEDQANEIDRLTARIDRLTKALKVSGVYPGQDKQVLSQLIDEGTENKLIPVEDWQSWSERGGLKEFIQWVPIQQIAETLIQLYNARDKAKALLYEVTGIGDIMRGMTSPEETFGAQELKAVFSTRRITPQQRRVAKFARNLLRLMGAVVAEHFSAETISRITGYPQLQPVPQLPPPPVMPPQLMSQMMAPGLQGRPAPGGGAPIAPAGAPAPAAPPGPGGPPGLSAAAPAPPPDPAIAAYEQAMAQWQQMKAKVEQIQAQNAQLQQQFQAAVAVLKQDGAHGFRIDIEADSTIAPDEQAEKAARVEFLKEMVPLLGQVIPMAQGNPPLADLAKEFVLFAARGFKVARPLEETIEKAFGAIAQMPPHPSQQAQGKAGDAGPDTPQALAFRAKELDSKESIAQQKNAVDLAKTASQERVAVLKEQGQQADSHARLVLEEQKLSDQRRFRDTKALGIAAHSAEGLT